MFKLSVRWSRWFSRLACAGAASLLLAATTLAQESDEEAELTKKVQNPVAALITVPFQSNFEWGAGPKSEGFKYTLNFQPVIPITLSEDWNLISRTIVPIIHQEDVVPNAVRTASATFCRARSSLRKRSVPVESSGAPDRSRSEEEIIAGRTATILGRQGR